jgi:PIN domain nuclease of toxin-antitoxin system
VLPSEPETYVLSRLAAQHFNVLDVKAAHALAVARLPLHHRDPFDRLLIAQSDVEQMTLVSADPLFSQYGVAPIA